MTFLRSLFPDLSSTGEFQIGDDVDFGYAAVAEQVGYVAGALTRAGVGPGDAIVFHEGQRPEALVLFWAAMAVGAVFAPVDPDWPDYIFERALASVHPKLVVGLVSRSQLYRRVFPASVFVSISARSDRQPGTQAVDDVDWAHWAAANPQSAALSISPGAPAAYLFTSGTTGIPKAVVLSRGALRAGALLTVDAFDWRPRERLVNLPEPHTMSGLRNGLVAAPLAGMTWIPFGAGERPDIFSLLENLARAQADRLVLGPSLLRQLAMLGDRIDPTCLAATKAVYCTGAMLSPLAVEGLYARYGLPVINYYGLTETGGICISQRLNGWRHNDRSLGVAAGAQLRLRDETGQATTFGVGELQVKSQQLMTGYLGDPAATAARFDDGWLRTGDLARIDGEGQVYLIGRESGFIKTASTDRVAPEEIETVLEEHPAVAEAAVLGLSTEPGIERIAALVVLRQGGGSENIDTELADFIADRLGAARTPSVLRFVAAIPRRDTGKIIRPDLQELLREHL